MNPEFREFERPFWELYELCRYNAVICRERVSAAMSRDGLVRWLLMLSVVGAAGCGTLKVATGVDTEVLWLGVGWIASAVAIWSFFRLDPEIRYEAFHLGLAFDDLAHDVAQATREGRRSGSASDLERQYRSLHLRLSDKVKQAGPHHGHYAERHRERLTQELGEVLAREGRIAPSQPALAGTRSETT